MVVVRVVVLLVARAGVPEEVVQRHRLPQELRAVLGVCVYTCVLVCTGVLRKQLK